VKVVCQRSGCRHDRFNKTRRKKEGVEKSKGYPPSDIRMKERKKEKERKGNQSNADEQDADYEQIGNNKNLVEMKSLYIIKLPNHAMVELSTVQLMDGIFPHLEYLNLGHSPPPSPMIKTWEV